MNEIQQDPFDLLPCPPKEGEPLSEQVCWDNPLAREVASPLFNADIDVAAITWRKGRRSKRFHWSTVHRFTLLLQGEMKALLARSDRICRIQPGELMYCPPRVGFSFVCDEDVTANWLYFYIKDTPFWDPLNKAGPYVKQYDSAPLVYILLRQILDAHRERDRAGMSAARGNAHMLTTILKRLRHYGPALVTNPKALDLRTLVEEISSAPAEEWTQKRMTERLHVSASTLLRLCRDTYGTSPKELLIQIRMRMAAQLLSDTDERLVDIAERVGYQSVYSFSRIFREHMGSPPIRFRRKSRSTLLDSENDNEAP